MNNNNHFTLEKTNITKGVPYSKYHWYETGENKKYIKIKSKDIIATEFILKENNQDSNNTKRLENCILRIYTNHYIFSICPDIPIVLSIIEASYHAEKARECILKIAEYIENGVRTIEHFKLDNFTTVNIQKNN